MKKKIAILDLLFHYPPSGGSWVDVHEIASRLMQREYEICLFVPDFSRYFPRGFIRNKLPYPVKSVSFGRFGFNKYTVINRFRKVLDKFEPDYLFLTDGYYLKPHLVNALAKNYKIILRFYAYEIFCGMNNFVQPQLKRNCPNHILKNQLYCLACLNWNYRTHKSIPKIIIGRNTDTSRLHFTQEYIGALAFSPFYPNQVKKALQNAYKIIVYNDFIANIIRNYTNKVQVIPSGIDINKFTLVDKPENSIKRILFSGRVNDPVKGYSVVLDACNQLWKKRQDFELILTLKNNKFITAPFIRSVGWLNPDELPKLYQSCDISLVPSIWEEAFGITALESMACGKPVIATAVGGLKQTVIDSQTGFLISPNNSQQLIDKITILLDNKDIRDKFGQAGRIRVVNEFNWDLIMDRYYIPQLI